LAQKEKAYKRNKKFFHCNFIYCFYKNGEGCTPSPVVVNYYIEHCRRMINH